MVSSLQELQSNDSDIKKILEKNIDDSCRIHDVNDDEEGCRDTLRTYCIAGVGDGTWLEAKLKLIFDYAVNTVDQDNTNCMHQWMSSNALTSSLTCCNTTSTNC